jgi:hypothetical protein
MEKEKFYLKKDLKGLLGGITNISTYFIFCFGFARKNKEAGRIELRDVL